MIEWEAARERLTAIFPPGFMDSAPEEQDALADAAENEIRSTNLDAWPTAELAAIREYFAMIASALHDSSRLENVLQAIRDAERMKPDTSIVPGQAVYTAARYRADGKPLADGEWTPIETYKKPVFPLEILPERLRELVEALHRDSGAAIDYFAGVALSVASLAVFDRADIILDGGRRQPLILYSVLVGGSGVKKSAAFHALQTPLIEWMEAQNRETARHNKRIEQRAAILRKDLEAAVKGKTKGTQGAQSPEAIQTQIEALEGQKRGFYPSPLTDATMESIARESQSTGGAVGILSDEGQIVNAIAGKSYTAKDGAPNIDVILKGYDRGFTNISRSTYSVKGNISVSLCIGAQPAILETLLSHGEQAERGFPQRCIFFYPAPVYDNAFDRTPCPLALAIWWRDTIQDLLTEGRTAGIELQATPDAITLCKAYENAMTAKRQEDNETGGNMAGWYAKAHDKVARVAGILALIEDPKVRTVTREHAAAAIRLFEEYALPMAQECYGIAGNDLPKYLEAILRAVIKEKSAQGAALEGAVYKRLHNLTRYRQGKPSTFDRDLQELAARGYLRCVNLDTGGRRGRPTTILQVNPYYTE